MQFLTRLSILIAVTCVSSLEFDCRRETQNCMNSGACRVSDGTCDCSGNSFLGYMCQLDPNLDQDDCEVACSLNYCLLPSMPDKCLCREGEYGTTCEYNRFQHICSIQDKIVVNINVIGADSVFVYNETLCPMNETGGDIPSGWEGAARVINLPDDDDCGRAFTDTNEDGTEIRCVTAYIRYRNDYWTDLDNTVTFCCSGTEVSGVTVQSIDVDKTLSGTTLQPKTLLSSDIDATFYDNSTGSEITGSAQIGQSIQLRFRLISGAASVGLKPIECTLQDAETSPDNSIDVISGGCPTNDLDPLILDYNDVDSYDLYFNMIKFVSSDIVYVVCKMRLCIEGSNCDESDCDRRKKREATTDSTSSEDVQDVVMKINVEDPFVKNEEAAEEAEVEEDEVVKKTEINLSAAVIGLGVVVLILLTICLILSVLLINKRRNAKQKS